MCVLAEEIRPQNTLIAGASESGTDLQFKPEGKWPADSYRPRQQGSHLKSRDRGGHKRIWLSKKGRVYLGFSGEDKHFLDNFEEVGSCGSNSPGNKDVF